jgi:hypothetical protein
VEVPVSKWVSLAGMLVVLVLAFGLDIAVAFLRVENARTFDFWRFLWLFYIVELAFAISIVAFGWLFLSKSSQSAAVSSIVLIIGLLMVFSFPLRMLFLNLTEPFLGPIESFLGPFGRFLDITPFTYEFHAAALLAVMGAAGLLRTIAGFRAGTHAPVPSNS